LKFKLDGTKLHGSWVLVRMRPRQWLLIKHRDKAASTINITAAKNRSAVSRRTLAAIARVAGATPRQLAQAVEADSSAADSLSLMKGIVRPSSGRISSPRYRWHRRPWLDRQVS